MLQVGSGPQGLQGNEENSGFRVTVWSSSKPAGVYSVLYSSWRRDSSPALSGCWVRGASFPSQTPLPAFWASPCIWTHGPTGHALLILFTSQPTAFLKFMHVITSATMANDMHLLPKSPAKVQDPVSRIPGHSLVFSNLSFSWGRIYSQIPPTPAPGCLPHAVAYHFTKFKPLKTNTNIN